MELSPCLLNEQHMPRSVGYIEKMLEQLTLTPFHMHLLIMAANNSKISTCLPQGIIVISPYSSSAFVVVMLMTSKQGSCEYHSNSNREG